MKYFQVGNSKLNNEISDLCKWTRFDVIYPDPLSSATEQDKVLCWISLTFTVECPFSHVYIDKIKQLIETAEVRRRVTTE